MTTISLQLLLATALLLLTVIAGLPSLLPSISNKLTKYLTEADAFSRGVFLGAGLTHLLPEAIVGFGGHHLSHTGLLIITATCALSFALMLWIEKCLPHHINSMHASYMVPLLLILALSTHSFVEGYALGLQRSAHGSILLFIAIISHKLIAAIAIGIKLSGSKELSYNSKAILFMLFACMTPFGVLAGIVSNQVLLHNQVIPAIANAIAAGTFVYIATMHDGSLGQGKHISVILFVIGISLMTLLGYTIPHHHH